MNPFHQGSTNQKSPFQWLAWVKRQETSENMFEGSTNEAADPFSFHLDDALEGAQNVSSTQVKSFDQVPRKRGTLYK